MLSPREMKRGGEKILAAEFDPRDMEAWDATVTQVRDVILKRHIAGPDFSRSMDLLPEASQYVPSQKEVEMVNALSLDAVTNGRVIDFGMLPNEVIKYGGNRGGPLWQQGAIGMPFDDPWILYHVWESGVGVYMVNPTVQGAEICELQPIKLDTTTRVLLISDRGIFFRGVDGPEPMARKYWSSMMPSMLRYHVDPEQRKRANGDAPTAHAGAAGNVGDPLMTALLILSTRNVERETVRAPIKLQNARRKSGKPTIPDYDRVNAAQYVTAILLRGRRRERGEDQGGTHRSPIPHIRLGHPRQYATGRSIFIADTLVNVPAEKRAAFKSNRSHYVVKP